MNKKKVFNIILIIICFLLITIFICRYFKTPIGEELLQDSESKWVYETNQYQAYKQFNLLIVNNLPEQLEYQGDITLDGISYYKYAFEGVTLKVYNNNNNEAAGNYVNYEVIYNNAVYIFKEYIPRLPDDLQIYYIDINKDGNKDIIVIGAPYSGSNNTHYWIHAIDITSMADIHIFSSEGGFLTEKQEEQLSNMLSKDNKFKELFSDLEGIGYSSVPKVDCFGKVYYELGLGKGILETIGEILILFDYNIESQHYDVVDYLFIPEYVQ